MSFLVALGAGAIYSSWALICRGNQCPSIEILAEYTPHQTSKLYAVDGRFISELGLDTKRLPSRSVAAVIGQAKADLTIRTSILEGRFLIGDQKLFDAAQARLAAVKPQMQARKAPRVDMTRVSQPVSGIATTSAIRYAVCTQLNRLSAMPSPA